MFCYLMSHSISTVFVSNFTYPTFERFLVETHHQYMTSEILLEVFVAVGTGAFVAIVTGMRCVGIVCGGECVRFSELCNVL